MEEYRFTITAEIELTDVFTYDMTMNMASALAVANKGIVNACNISHDENMNGFVWIDVGFPTKYYQQKAKKMLRRRARGKPKFNFSVVPRTVIYKKGCAGDTYMEERTEIFITNRTL